MRAACRRDGSRAFAAATAALIAEFGSCLDHGEANDLVRDKTSGA
jgi:hypothetical protein